MDQNNGLEAKISEEETRTTLPMDLREVSPQLVSFQTKFRIWEWQSEQWKIIWSTPKSVIQ